MNENIQQEMILLGKKEWKKLSKRLVCAHNNLVNKLEKMILKKARTSSKNESVEFGMISIDKVKYDNRGLGFKIVWRGTYYIETEEKFSDFYHQLSGIIMTPLQELNKKLNSKGIRIKERLSQLYYLEITLDDRYYGWLRAVNHPRLGKNSHWRGLPNEIIELEIYKYL